MKKVYSEIGFGSESFLNTEIEVWKKGEEISEYRIKKFLFPKKIKEVYLRVWINKKVLVLSTKEIKIQNKNKKKYKFLFGIGGENLKNQKYDRED